MTDLLKRGVRRDLGLVVAIVLIFVGLDLPLWREFLICWGIATAAKTGR